MFPVLLVAGAIEAGPVIAMNPDAGETIGWPEIARTVAGVYDRAPGPAVLFAANDGEAGALDRYGPALGLPPAYSGHNAFADWGPPDRPGAVVVVGLDPADLGRAFRGAGWRRASATRPASTTTSAAPRSSGAPARAAHGRRFGAISGISASTTAPPRAERAGRRAWRPVGAVIGAYPTRG